VKISVITIVYNDVKNILKTVESVLSQSGELDLEYIIIDGASSDGTLDAISHYHDKFMLFSGADTGIYDAINKGVKSSNGDLLIFMNSGDAFYSNDSLKVLLEHYDDKVGFCLARTEYKYDNNRTKEDSLYLRNSNLPEFCHQSLLYSKRLHSEFGLYNQKLKSAADYDFFHKIYNTKNKAVKLNVVTSIRLKSGNDSSESLRNTIEMIRVDFYNSCLIYSFRFRLKDLLAKTVKLFINQVLK